MQVLITTGIILLFSFLGFYMREEFSSLKPYVPYMLSLVMLSMGITLKASDFVEVFRKPLRILYAGLLQYSLMPLLGFGLAVILKLEDSLLYGAVLVGSAPGGTASNVITYLSRGDVAYSVSMTAFSTLLSPIMTPLLTYLLIGKRVEVPFQSMALDLLFLVLLPVMAGIAIRKLFPQIARMERLLPYVAVFFIGLIIAVVIALNADRLYRIGAQVILLVVLHNLFGFALGYVFGRLAGLDRRLSKTLSIEVGMQNSGLATLLALKYFPPESALPGTLFSLLQNINGLVLSLIYRRL